LQLPVEPQDGQVSASGWNEVMKSRNRDLDEVFMRIILQNREFFLIISIDLSDCLGQVPLIRT